VRQVICLKFRFGIRGIEQVLDSFDEFILKLGWKVCFIFSISNK
jgi:hypothetical protein